MARLLTLLGMVPRPRLALLLALMIASSLTEGVGLLMLVPLLGALQPAAATGHGTLAHLATFLPVSGEMAAASLLLAFIGLITGRSLLTYSREVLGRQLQNELVDHLRERCFSALMHAEWRWLSQRRQSEHANLLLTDIERVGVGLDLELTLLASLGTLGAYTVAALLMSWPLAVLAFSSGGLAFALMRRQRRRALTLGISLGETHEALHAAVHDSLAGLKLAKILGNESQYRAALKLRMQGLRQQEQQFQRDTSASRSMLQVGGTIMLCACLYAGLTYWKTPVTELLTLVLIFARMIPQISGLQGQWELCLHVLPALDETRKLLRASEQAAEPVAAGAAIPLTVENEIRFDGIGVFFDGRERPALESVNLVLKARTTTALMGPSGAGKSTLADILIGLLSPDRGTLSVDGQIITGAARMTWRGAVSYVPQEVTLFHDSIRSNLLWGSPGASDDQLEQALRRAAADFVFDLPQRLDTVIGDQGVRLSGGERQRLALGRALLRRPALLILDEATSALDRDNELRIRQAIENLHGDLTVVIIGHRLSTLEHADQVVVLEQGRVRACGKWADIQEHTGV